MVYFKLYSGRTSQETDGNQIIKKVKGKLWAEKEREEKNWRKEKEKIAIF